MNTQQSDFQKMVNEWSTSQAELNHVETIEEANDFGIEEDAEDQDFFHNLTVYEMHEAAEDNLAAHQAEQAEILLAESNEPGDLASMSPNNTQSAQIEPNSLGEPQPNLDQSLNQPATADDQGNSRPLAK
nr:MAG: hypothetical protein [Microvirus sp.]